jgi:hypothetical protein
MQNKQRADRLGASVVDAGEVGAQSRIDLPDRCMIVSHERR